MAKIFRMLKLENANCILDAVSKIYEIMLGILTLKSLFWHRRRLGMCSISLVEFLNPFEISHIP
jgi:hypothetical protein